MCNSLDISPRAEAVDQPTRPCVKSLLASSSFSLQLHSRHSPCLPSFTLVVAKLFFLFSANIILFSIRIPRNTKQYQRGALQRRVNGPHVKAHGKRNADMPGGFPHIDRGGWQVEGWGVEQGSLVPKLLWSFSSLHCHPESPCTPPVAPLSSPSLPFTSALRFFAFLFSLSSPTLNAFTYWPLTPLPDLSSCVILSEPSPRPRCLLPSHLDHAAASCLQRMITRLQCKLILPPLVSVYLWGALSFTSLGFTACGKLH